MIHYVFLLCYDTIKKYRNNIFNNTPTGRSRIQTWQEEDEMPKIGERYIFDLRKCKSKPRWKGYIEEKSLEITSKKNNERKSLSTILDSVKPKPWHLIKKCGIIPDGLVQTPLNHLKLTNGNKGEGALYQDSEAERREPGLTQG